MESYKSLLDSGPIFSVSVDLTKINCMFKILSEELQKTNQKLDNCNTKLERSEKDFEIQKSQTIKELYGSLESK